jgi:hypothetical protein
MIGDQLFPRLYTKIETAIEIVREERLRAAVMSGRAMWVAILAERSRERRGLALERLTAHYPNQAKDRRAFKMWASDFMADFKNTPPLIFEEACREWRLSPERWLPTPGQLMVITERICKRYEAELRHLENICEAIR